MEYQISYRQSARAPSAFPGSREKNANDDAPRRPTSVSGNRCGRARVAL
jgi:hypothetical protein